MSLAVACAFVFGLYASHSHAQLYKWIDENGKVQYSDTVPPTATDRARKELRSDGTIKHETERAATAEEKRLAAMKAAEEAKAREIQAERDRKDKALLATYTDLKDFDRVRDRALATLDSEIRVLTERESFLGKVLATPEGQAPPTVTAPVAPEADKTPAPAAKATPAKAGPAKSANARMLEARAELPRVTDTLTRKRRDRADLITQYTGERIRLANLFDAERIRQESAKTAAAAVAPAVPFRK